MHPPPRPPAPCPDFTHLKLAIHWHYPAWAALAQFGDRWATDMLLRWWPISRRARRAA